MTHHRHPHRHKEETVYRSKKQNHQVLQQKDCFQVINCLCTQFFGTRDLEQTSLFHTPTQPGYVRKTCREPLSQCFNVLGTEKCSLLHYGPLGFIADGRQGKQKWNPQIHHLSLQVPELCTQTSELKASEFLICMCKKVMPH